MNIKPVYGYVWFIWLAIQQITQIDLDPWGIASLLGVLCLFVLKENYLDKNYSSFLFLIIIIIMSSFHGEFILLAVIPIFDFLYFRNYLLGTLAFIITLALYILNFHYDYSIHLVFAALLGYVLGKKTHNEKNHTEVLDQERRLRYRLEAAQMELIHSRKEIEHLTEIRERNRIAQEIHDHVGHSIAGVIFQIEAAKRIMNKDKEKLESMLKLCSLKLAEALKLTRNTVYNIKPDNKTGVDLLEKIVNDFKFCKISFEHNGNFSAVSILNMNILESLIMEPLTNASKYSNAENIQIIVDIKKKEYSFLL